MAAKRRKWRKRFLYAAEFSGKLSGQGQAAWVRNLEMKKAGLTRRARREPAMVSELLSRLKGQIRTKKANTFAQWVRVARKAVGMACVGLGGRAVQPFSKPAGGRIQRT